MGNPCREVGGDPPQPSLKGREVGGLRSKVKGRTLNVGTHEMRPQAAILGLQREILLAAYAYLFVACGRIACVPTFRVLFTTSIAPC